MFIICLLRYHFYFLIADASNFEDIQMLNSQNCQILINCKITLSTILIGNNSLNLVLSFHKISTKILCVPLHTLICRSERKLNKKISTK